MSFPSESFTTIVIYHTWVLNTPAARSRLMSDGLVFCRCCNRLNDDSRSLGVGLSAANSSNVSKHAGTKAHTAAAVAAVGQSQLSLAVVSAVAVHAAAQQKRDQRSKAMTDLRAAFTSKLMGVVPKSVIMELFDPETLEVVEMLKGFKLGAAGTVERDIEVAVKATETCIACQEAGHL